MHVSSFVSIPNIIAHTDLIAIVPRRIAKHFNHSQPQQANLQCLALPFHYPQVQMQLLWHKSREHDMAHQWVRERIDKLIHLLPD
jgi:DNA-binding transcriptional LysR family regulator